MNVVANAAVAAISAVSDQQQRSELLPSAPLLPADPAPVWKEDFAQGLAAWQLRGAEATVQLETGSVAKRWFLALSPAVRDQTAYATIAVPRLQPPIHVSLRFQVTDPRGGFGIQLHSVSEGADPGNEVQSDVRWQSERALSVGTWCRLDYRITHDGGLHRNHTWIDGELVAIGECPASPMLGLFTIRALSPGLQISDVAIDGVFAGAISDALELTEQPKSDATLQQTTTAQE